jgi:hypothetical protein
MGRGSGLSVTASDGVGANGGYLYASDDVLSYFFGYLVREFLKTFIF